MRNASYIERNILEASFGRNQFLSGYFEHEGRRTRDYAIVLRISEIGHHRPFGFVVSRSADAEAPKDELPLHYLVGCENISLFGSFRVGEKAQKISEKIHLYTATGKELGEFDVPPLASFYVDEVRDVIPRSAENGERFVQYFFCAPLPVWPGSSAEVFSLEGDGKFVWDKQIYRYSTSDKKLEIEVAPFSRYPERSKHQQLGPEMFREPLAESMNLGEQATNLILNGPQASFLIKTSNPEICDETFSEYCNHIASTLVLIFSFISGSRCYWHTRAQQLSQQCEVTYVDNGDWHSSVEFEPIEYPFKRENHATFFEFVVERSIENKDFSKIIELPIQAYLSCLSARNLRDRFILICLVLEDLSKSHKYRIIPKKEWKGFVRSLMSKFPRLGLSNRFLSNISHLAQATFAQRLEAWAKANCLQYDDLDKADPFREIVITRNKIVHGYGLEELSDKMIFLQLSKAMTLLERYIFSIIGWQDGFCSRPVFDRPIHLNIIGEYFKE